MAGRGNGGKWGRKKMGGKMGTIPTRVVFGDDGDEDDNEPVEIDVEKRLAGMPPPPTPFDESGEEPPAGEVAAVPPKEEEAEFDVDAIIARIEKTYRLRVADDDVIRIELAAVYQAIRAGSRKSIERCLEETAKSMEQYHQGLNYAANEKKLEVRRDLIQFASAIHEKLRVETNELHAPLVQRIGDLKQVAEQIARNHGVNKWKDRIVGLVIALMLVLLGFGSGLVYVLEMKKG